jgi:DNA-binding transcriptional LysR family regulator
MELYQLKYFEAVSRFRNFSKAAIEMNVSQPTISIAMQKFEKELGISLFDKHNKPITLTPLGESVLQRTERILMEIDNIYKEATDHLEPKNILQIGMPLSLCNNLILLLRTQFPILYPQIHIDLSQLGVEVLEDELSKGNFDFCLICGPITRPELQECEYHAVELYACFSKNHPLAVNEKITPKMLEGIDLLLPEHGLGVSKHIYQYLAKHGIIYDAPHNGRLHPQTMLKLAAQNMGVAMLEKNYVRGYASTDIISRPLDPPLNLKLILAWNKDNYQKKTMRILLDFLNDYKSCL